MGGLLTVVGSGSAPPGARARRVGRRPGCRPVVCAAQVDPAGAGRGGRGDSARRLGRTAAGLAHDPSPAPARRRAGPPGAAAAAGRGDGSGRGGAAHRRTRPGGGPGRAHRAGAALHRLHRRRGLRADRSRPGGAGADAGRERPTGAVAGDLAGAATQPGGRRVAGLPGGVERLRRDAPARRWAAGHPPAPAGRQRLRGRQRAGHRRAGGGGCLAGAAAARRSRPSAFGGAPADATGRSGRMAR